MEAAKVTAVVARVVGDVGLAEDLAQDAFVQALEQWPRDGMPDKPGAWLTSTARRRAIDRIRRDVNLASKLQQVGHMEELRVADLAEADFDAALEDIDDDVLGLDLRRVPPRAHRPGADLLDAEDDRRAHHPRDRARLPHDRGDDRAAHLASEEDPEPGRRHHRGPLGRRARPATRVGARGRLPHLQRGVCRDVGSRLGARRPHGGGHPARPGRSPPSPRASPRCTACSPSWRSRRRAPAPASAATASPVLLLDQDRTRWDWALIRHALAALDRATARRHGRRHAGALRPAGRDRRVPRAGPHRRGRPTGRGSCPLRAARPRASVARHRPQPRCRAVVCRRAGRRARGRRRAGRRRDRSRTTTCCPACAVTCSPVSAATRRRARSSPVRPAMTQNEAEQALLLRRACGTRLDSADGTVRPGRMYQDYRRITLH